jgi:hypothetical protein
MLQDLHIDGEFVAGLALDREFAADSEGFGMENVLEMKKRIGQVYTWTNTFIHSFVHLFCCLSYDRSIASSKARSPLGKI